MILSRDSYFVGAFVLLGALIVLGIAIYGSLAAAAPTRNAAAIDEGGAVLLDINGAIGPATSDYVVRGLGKAKENHSRVVILRMDTPGGLDHSMRAIVKAILDSPVPVVSYVAPSGARAASAGTYILYASHLAAMAPATTLGAATPVQIGGLPGMPEGKETHSPENDSGKSEDEKKEASHAPASNDTMKTKIVNDAAAYIKGLANRYGRNAQWAERAVREAVSLTAKEALEQDVIDLIAADVPDLLNKINGRTVQLQDRESTLSTEGVVVETYAPDWRSQLLSVITDPNVAYIMMLIGVYGLIFELANPGSVLPGVVGGICLLLSLYAFQVLPINYAGLGLMILGIMLMLAEAFVPSFGVLGFGGIAAFVMGSVILMGEEQLSISLPLIGGTALGSAGFFMWVLGRLIGISKRPAVSGAEQMVGATARVLDEFESEGRVWIHSEAWRARTMLPLTKGQTVRVVSRDGLVLNVEPADQNDIER